MKIGAILQEKLEQIEFESKIWNVQNILYSKLKMTKFKFFFKKRNHYPIRLDKLLKNIFVRNFKFAAIS